MFIKIMRKLKFGLILLILFNIAVLVFQIVVFDNSREARGIGSPLPPLNPRQRTVVNKYSFPFPTAF